MEIKKYQGRTLSGVTVENKILKNHVFEECTIDNCSFINATLKDCKFDNCKFVNCKFISTANEGSDFKECVFEKCNLLSEEIEAKNAEITRLSGIVTGLEVQVKFFCKELEKKEAETNIKHADNKESLLSLLFKLILKLFKGEK